MLGCKFHIPCTASENVFSVLYTSNKTYQTHRGSGLNRFYSFIKNTFWQTKIGCTAVHNAFIIVVLKTPEKEKVTILKQLRLQRMVSTLSFIVSISNMYKLNMTFLQLWVTQGLAVLQKFQQISKANAQFTAVWCTLIVLLFCMYFSFNP